MPQNLIDAIKQAQKEQKWQKVIELCDELHKQFPDKWEFLWFMGQAYKNLVQYDLALEYFTLLKERFPEKHQGWEGIINVAQHQQDWLKVIELVKSFQLDFPHAWQGLWWTGQAYKNLVQYDLALEYFTLLKERFPEKHQGWEGIINVAQHQQDWLKVIELVKSFQLDFPHAWQGLWWTGQAYKNLVQYDLALEHFTLLKERFPEKHQGWEGIINVAQHQQDWLKVIELVKSFQLDFPHAWQGLWWTGQAYKNLVQYDLALEHFTLLKERFPEKHQGWEGIINVAQHQQDWLKVIELVKSFQLDFPHAWQGLWWAGQAYKNLVQYDLALEHFTLLKERFPEKHQGWEGIINVAQHQQDWLKVIELVKSFQLDFPHAWQGLWWTGQAYKNLVQYDLALEHFTLLKERFPEKHQGWEGIINVAQHQQDWLKVIELVKSFQLDFPHAWQGLWWAGQAYKNLVQYDLALEHFTLLKERFPEKHQGWEGIINVAQHQQDWLKVIELVKSFQLDFPHAWQGLWWTGQAYKNLVQYDLALEHFTLLKERFPEKHQGWEGIINVAQHQQDWLKVIELVKSFQLDFPHAWQGLWWAGQAYKNLVQYDLALEHFTLLKERFPEKHQGWEGIINVAQHQQDWLKVIELVKSFQLDFPHAWQGLWWAGQAYKNLVQYDLALEHFTLLKERFPEKHQGWEGIINVAQHQQDWLKVIELVKSFQLDFPHAWQGLWWGGQAHKNLYQYEQAKSAFQTLIVRFPYLSQGYEGMVNIWEHQNDWQTVLEHTLIFRQHFPHLWQSYYWEGLVYRHLGRYDEAQTVFHVMTQNFLNQHHGWNGLIDVANDQADWENALSWCDLAIESLPNYLPFHQRKGRALIGLKQFDAAETYLVHLQKRFPNETIPLLGLADVYVAQRKKEKEKMVLLMGALLFPERENMVQRLIQRLNHYGETDLAQAIYQKYIHNHHTVTNLIIKNNFYRIQWGNQGNVDFRAQMFQQYPHDLTFARRYANILIRYVEEF